ncbi:MAG: hypothetical protein ACOCW4_01355 [bacterium]
MGDENDTINAGENLEGSEIYDPSLNDEDVLNATIDGTTTPDSIRNVEILNLDFKFGAKMDMDDVVGAQTVNVSVDQGSRAAFLNIDDTYQFNADDTVETLRMDDDASLLMDGDEYTLQGLDADGAGVNGIDILIESNDAANTFELASATLSTDIEVSGDSDLTLKGLAASGAEVVNTLDGAELIVELGNNDTNVEDVAADRFKFTESITAGATLEFKNGDTVELTKNDNTADFDLVKDDDSDSISVIANIENAVGALDFGTGSAGDAGFETINYTAGKEQDVTFAIKSEATVDIDGTSNLTVNFNGTDASGATINAADLEGNLTITAADSIQGTDAAIVGGIGDDDISLGAAIDDELAIILSQGGNNTVTFDQNITGPDGDAYVEFGAGQDTFLLSGADVVTGASLEVRGGDGADDLTLNLTGSTISASEVTFKGEAGDDTLTLDAQGGGISAGAEVTFNGGVGDDTFVLTDAGFSAGTINDATIDLQGGDGTDSVLLGAGSDTDVNFTFASATTLKASDIDEFVMDANDENGADRDVNLTFENANKTLDGEFNFVGENDDANTTLHINVLDTQENTDLADVSHSGLDSFYIFANSDGKEYIGTQGDETYYIGQNNDTASAFAAGTTGGATGIEVGGEDGADTFVLGLASCYRSLI